MEAQFIEVKMTEGKTAELYAGKKRTSTINSQELVAF